MRSKAKRGYVVRVVMPSLVFSADALAVALAIVRARRAKRRKESKR